MSILKSRASSILARTGVTVAVAAVAVAGLAAPSQAVTAVTQQALTLSSMTGNIAGGQTITLSLASTASPKFTSGQVGVQFQATTALLAATATCSTAPSTAATSSINAAAASLRFLSTTKVSIVVPALTGGSLVSPSGYWLVCAYNAANATPIPSTATVVGKANYLVAAAPTATAVTPANGPAVGGQTVTITGGGFPLTVTAATPLTATIGGLPLTNITPVGTGSFTAVTPARASAANLALSVTTAGGTVTTPALYSYVNGVTVSPNTVPSGVSVDIDVQGTGFNLLDFSTTTGATPNDGNGHVYLVQGVYSATGFAVGSVDKPVGETSECVNVAVISDTELICTVDAAYRINVAANVYTYETTALTPASYLQNGSYTVTVVSSGLATAPTKTVLSSGATFTVADF